MKPPAVTGRAVVTLTERHHVFPFTAPDSTPGGTNLGRIEWHVEMFRTAARRKREIGGILLWASQTRDARYLQRSFWLPCATEALHGRRLSREPGDGFLDCVWIVRPCELHHGLVFSAYPGDRHGELVADLTSSISAELWFQSGSA